jgi:hypothetical protein
MRAVLADGSQLEKANTRAWAYTCIAAVGAVQQCVFKATEKVTFEVRYTPHAPLPLLNTRRLVGGVAAASTIRV